MLSRKNRAANRILPVSAFLNCEDRKKFSAFVALMVAVNKRINPDEYAAPARMRSKKKTKECKLENLYKEGSQSGGPCLLLIIYALLCILDRKKIFIMVNAYDRYSSFTSSSRFIPNY